MAALDWMAWTGPTALFFGAIASALVLLTVWELRAPSITRRGFLPMESTRGDRFFISLLFMAFVHIAFVGLTDWPVWWASVACMLSTLAIMRWG